MEPKDQLGMAIDRVDNLIGSLELPIPPSMHVEQLKKILPEVVAELKDGFVGVTGENPWEV